MNSVTVEKIAEIFIDNQIDELREGGMYLSCFCHQLCKINRNLVIICMFAFL